VVATSSEESQNEVAAGRRFYGIAGLTVQVESDLPITDTTFEPKFAAFEVAGPGSDTIVVRLHFGLPAIDEGALGREVYRRTPWVIYRSPIKSRTSWVRARRPRVRRLRDPDHTTIDVFNGERREESYREGGVNALTMMPTDQIVLARVLADRRGLLSALVRSHSRRPRPAVRRPLRGRQVHDDDLLAADSEALCDDRNIVRIWDDGIRVHGCWSHGEVPIVSAASAPLGAVLFLRQATTNRVVPLAASEEILGHLLPCVIKPLVTADWWERTLDVVGRIVKDVPCYVVEFDKSGAVVALLRDLVAGQIAGAVGQCGRAGVSRAPKESEVAVGLNVSRDAVYKPSDDLVVREIDGQTIIVPIGTGIGDLEDELYALNDTARVVWAKLDGTHTVAVGRRRARTASTRRLPTR
jgi:hypothetical protein